MKRLQRLRTLTTYLQEFRIPEFPEIIPRTVVDNENATGQLSSAAGDQVLVALPEIQQTGRSSDEYSSYISAAFFILAKINGPARTPALAAGTYERLMNIADGILARLEDDITGGGTSAPCPLLAGLSLTDLNVMPLYSVFGGWSGYALEISFS